MKLHIITIGKPRLDYAQVGWSDYFHRLSRLHSVRSTHLADRHALDSAKICEAQGSSYRVVMEIDARQYSSMELALCLSKLELLGKEVSFLIGGPDGLPADIRKAADLRWSLANLTLPHDLAMVVMLEALYRSSMINAGLSYHR